MKKTLILFTGPSTSGKTTFVQLLMGIDENFYPMVQASSRSPRADDDPRFLRLYDSETYEKQNFWIRSKQYGIVTEDIKRFLESDKPISIGIVGVRELIKAKEQVSDVLDVKIALVRLSSDPSKEEAILSDNIKKYFSSPEVRLEQNKRHLQEFFLNDTFIKNYVDIILPRDCPLAERVHLFGEMFRHELTQKITKQEIDSLFFKLKQRERM